MDRQEISRQRTEDLFDRCAPRYHAMLNRALAPSGEVAQYFAQQRVSWLQGRLRRLGFAPSTVLDYGCGTGGSVPFLKEILRPERILGVDISAESLRQARQQHAGEGIEFADCSDYSTPGQFQLAFCNGVFHHVSPGERPAALRYIYDSLMAAGVLAWWENNPWNPATRFIMGRCELDQEALPITIGQARRLLFENGFQVINTSSYFYFPRWLKWLRGLEPALSHLPLGAQYLVLARKRG